MSPDSSKPILSPIGLAAEPTFSSIRAPDLVGLIQTQLQNAILEGRLAPGARIVEAELARQMGVSRAPVREAARRLESAGLVVSRPRHGFAVRTMSAKEIDDLYAVRIQLELMAVALACQHASNAGLDALAARVEDMVARADQLSRPERVAADLAFHGHICALSGNDYLLRLFENMLNEVRMLLAWTEDTFGSPQDLAATHRPIVQAIRARDVQAAQAALRYHLDEAREHAGDLVP